MSPLTFEQLVALLSVVFAAATIALTIRRDGMGERERQAARAAEQQVVTDQLANITDMARETRDTVRDMSRQLTDHSRELARVEQRMDDYGRRIEAIERRCEGCRIGGSE